MMWCWLLKLSNAEKKINFKTLQESMDKEITQECRLEAKENVNVLWNVPACYIAVSTAKIIESCVPKKILSEIITKIEEKKEHFAEQSIPPETIKKGLKTGLKYGLLTGLKEVLE